MDAYSGAVVVSIVFRAGDEPVASRVERLRHEVGDTIAPIDVDPMVSPAEINDQIHAQEAGTVRVVAMSLTQPSGVGPLPCSQEPVT